MGFKLGYIQLTESGLAGHSVWINIRHIIKFERRQYSDGKSYTKITIPSRGDYEEVVHVEETPEEIMNKIRYVHP